MRNNAFIRDAKKSHMILRTLQTFYQILLFFDRNSGNKKEEKIFEGILGILKYVTLRRDAQTFILMHREFKEYLIENMRKSLNEKVWRYKDSIYFPNPNPKPKPKI